jgi:ABC-type transport system involved in cytochrome c biogenesis permease subunit
LAAGSDGAGCAVADAGDVGPVAPLVAAGAAAWVAADVGAALVAGGAAVCVAAGAGAALVAAWVAAVSTADASAKEATVARTVTLREQSRLEALNAAAQRVDVGEPALSKFLCRS